MVNFHNIRNDALRINTCLVYLTYLLLTSVHAPVSAQTVGLGVKIGANVTTLTGPDVPVAPQVQSLAGFAGGIYRTLPLTSTERLFLQVELLYSQQGYRLSNSDTRYKATLRSYYACLPLMARLVHRGFFVEAGPQISYLTGVKEKYQFQPPGGTTLMRSLSTDPRGYVRWDIAYAVGGGYCYKGGLSLNLRYQRGISSIYHSGSRMRNAGWQLQANYPLFKPE